MKKERKENFDPTIWILAMADINEWSLAEALAYHNELIQRAINIY